MKKKIHMLGICGTGMGSLAILLKESGFTVTGSDENVYPPMSTQLENAGIKIFKGYKAEHLTPSPPATTPLAGRQPSPPRVRRFFGGRGEVVTPDVVIIGNVISRGNPEAEAVLVGGTKYLSMPQAVSEFFLKGKHSIVVTGTHGKTTTSTLCAWVLESAGLAPGFLIGGVGQNFGVSARLGMGDFFVVEGDEYDTAFFDKGPKFLHYQPRSVILGPVEFDHADIYQNLAHVMSSFEKLVAIIPKDGLLVACADSENTLKLASKAACRVVTYGISEKADYHPEKISATEEGTAFQLQRFNCSVSAAALQLQRCSVSAVAFQPQRYSVSMWGNHNLQNTMGVIALLAELGISGEKIARGVASFKNVKRRQEVRSTTDGITIIDDFAHHPTAVKETIFAMRMKYKNSRLISVFEPRSNTSRRNIFQHEFANALADSDITVISGIHRPEKLAKSEQLNVDALVEEIGQKGAVAHHLRNTNEIVDFLAKTARKGDVILIMSNGGFDNIHEKLAARFKNATPP